MTARIIKQNCQRLVLLAPQGPSVPVVEDTEASDHRNGIRQKKLKPVRVAGRNKHNIETKYED